MVGRIGPGPANPLLVSLAEEGTEEIGVGGGGAGLPIDGGARLQRVLMGGTGDAQLPRASAPTTRGP